MIFKLVVIAVVAFVAWGVFYHTPKSRRLQKDKAERLAASALQSLDRIVGGKHYRGSECEVVATFWSGGRTIRLVGSPSRYIPFSAEQLCKTKRGAWFFFDPESNSVTPCDEATAKSRIADDIELYSRHFGTPDIA